MLARRPRNDPEIVSAHARDGELRPGCHLNSSKHTGFEDNQRSDDRHSGTQHDPIPVRVMPRRSVYRPHPSMSENTLHYADLDGRDATGSWHDMVESEPLYIGDDTEYPDLSVSSTISCIMLRIKMGTVIKIKRKDLVHHVRLFFCILKGFLISPFVWLWSCHFVVGHFIAFTLDICTLCALSQCFTSALLFV